MPGLLLWGFSRSMRVGEYFHVPFHGQLHEPATRHDATASSAPPRSPFSSHPHDEEIAALISLGFGKPLIQRLENHAKAHGTSIEKELLASVAIREDAYFAAMARFLRLPFNADINPVSIADTDTLDVQLLRPNQIRLAHAKKAPEVAIVPEAARLAELAALLDRLPALRQGLVITTPSQIRSAVWAAGATRRARAAITDLFENAHCLPPVSSCPAPRALPQAAAPPRSPRHLWSRRKSR